MGDSDIVFLGSHQRGARSDDVLPADYFAQETQRRLAPQTNQANGHHDRNNNTDLTGASTSNGIRISQMNNRNPPGTSSRQDNMHPPSGMHVDIFENMLQPVNFQQLTDTYINNPRLAPRTNQANRHYDRNNYTDLTGASTSNEIRSSQMNNRNPPGTSSRQDNMRPPSGVHMDIFENMLQPVNFQQLTDTYIYNPRLAPQTNQANEHHDRNNNTNLTGASTSNGIPSSQLNNRYPPCGSSWQNNMGFHSEKMLEEKMLQAVNFQQLTKATASLGPYNIFKRSSPCSGEMSGDPCAMPTAPPRDLYERLATVYPSTNDYLYSLQDSRANSTSGRNPYPNFTMQEPAASSSGHQSKSKNNTPKDSSNYHEPYKEPAEPVPKRINPPRKVKAVPEAAIGTDGANRVPPKPAKRSASVPSLKTKAKSRVGRPSKVQKVAEPQPMNPGVAQEESSYQHLLNLNAADLVTTTEDDYCPGCLVWVLAGDGVVLKDCLHTFCRVCLQNVILHSETAQVGCPFANEEYACESHLQEREIKCLVSAEEYEHHLARSLSQAQSQASNAFHCRTPGCTGWCLFEGSVGEFLCPVCSRTNCLTCWDIHEGIECKEHMRCMFSQSTDAAAQSSEGVEPSSEEAQNYQSLLVLNDMGLVTNKERFDCPICFSDIEVGQGVTLKDCLHNYCRECLAGTIHHSETVLVKCPFANDDYSCESYLQEREIKCLVTPDEYERHLARSMALVESQAKNSFHCKTPDCPGWCLVEDDVNWFFCEVCSNTNCLTCAAIHLGKNCKQYQDWLAFESDTSEDARKTREYLKKQVKSNHAMECPTCRVIVMKRDGCDYLRCSMCRTEICWATRGPRWGFNGPGDTTGGCKCDWFNKKPCHPKCRGCH